MATTATEPADFTYAPEHSPDSELLALNRAASDLGAGSLSLLFSDGPRTEATHSWSRFGSSGPSPEFLHHPAELMTLLGNRSGSVEADSRLAQLLRDSISPHSQSFLIFPWRIQQQVVTLLLGFDSATPPYPELSDRVIENLRLFALAIWSVKEIARLRAELKIVNNRLAGRKSVERAKGVLQSERSFSEEQAYEYLRGLSRKRRITLEELAEEVLGGRVVNSEKA